MHLHFMTAGYSPASFTPLDGNRARLSLQRILLPLLIGFLMAGCQHSPLAASKPDSVPVSQPVAKMQEIMPIPDRKPFFPQLTPPTREREFPSALVAGTLTQSDDCLRILGDDKTSYLIIWPPQVRLEVSGDSIRIFDEKSQATARLGQTVKLGGGEIQTGASIFKELRYPIPKNCLGPYWLASEILP
jgi:hypothetical protein